MTPLLTAGTNYVYHARAESLLRWLPDDSVDLVWIDPPYGNNNGVDDLAGARARDKVKGGRQRGEIMPIANDSFGQWEALMRRVLPEINRVLKPVGCLACCTSGGGPTPTYAYLTLWLAEYLEFFHAVIWDKSRRGNGMGWRYRRNYEFVMVAYKKGGQLSWNESRPARPNVLNYPPTRNEHHPTEKPISLVEEFIFNHTKEGDLVLDCFAGGGTTLVAAQRHKRNFIGCDLAGIHVATTNNRLSKSEPVPMFAA